MYEKSLVLIFPLVVLVILSSGCVSLGPFGTISTPVYGGAGVVIIGFAPYYDRVDSGSSMNFQARIRNTGSFDSGSVGASISLSQSGWTCTGSQESNFTLIAAYPETGVEGEERVITWRCTAPNVKSGVSVPYDARAIVTYHYLSEATKNVVMLPMQDLNALGITGESRIGSQSMSNSPIRVQLQVDEPVVVDRRGGSEDFVVKVIIENAGGGSVNNNRVTLKMKATGITMKSCKSESIELWGGKAQVSCSATANNVEVITEGEITALLDYYYVTSSTARITVVGTQ